MHLAVGDKLGPYEILGPIGAGGMGEVYRALDTRLHRTVAIKILPHDKLADADRKRRFLQEARAASALMHPNIVVLHDISSDNRMDFLVMEYVHGNNLKERIKAGRLPADQVVRFGIQIASALAAAHAAGIVHRDIKPANIMVTPESQIQILDFGRVLEGGLGKDKQDSYGAASEMMQALQALESGYGTAAVPRRSSRTKWWLVGGLSALLVAAGAIAIYQWSAAKRHTPDPQAYQLYLQGRRNLQEYTEHGFRQSLADFKNAIKRDPEYAAAYAGLADAYSYLACFEIERPKDAMPLAESNAAKAIEKDPQTAEAYTSLGIVALAYYWDFPLAEQRFERALKLKPGDVFTQHFLGHYYEFMGKWPEALSQMQRAHDMEKLSPMYGEALAWDLFMNRHNDDAIQQLRETVGLAPEDPLGLAVLGMALEATGKSGESLEQAQQAMKLPGRVAGAGCL